MKKHTHFGFYFSLVFILSFGFVGIFSTEAAIYKSCNSEYNGGASDCQSGGDDNYWYSGSCLAKGVIDETETSCNERIKYYTRDSNTYTVGTSVPSESLLVQTNAWGSCSCNSTCNMEGSRAVEHSVRESCDNGEVVVFNQGSCEYSCETVTPTYLTKYAGGVGSEIQSSIMFQDDRGYIGIGTSSPTESLEINGNILAVEYLYSSDIRLKENISPLKNALNKVLELTGVSFSWKKSGEKNIGFIAQEVEQVVPDIVKGKGEKMKSVSYGNITALLVEAIKEQQKQINELKALVKKLSP